MIDNYLENIKNEIISGNAKVVAKNYQINNVKLTMNYNIGKELAEAGKHYGEGLVKKYAKELTEEFGKGYKDTELRKMRCIAPHFDLEPLFKTFAIKKSKWNKLLHWYNNKK